MSLKMSFFLKIFVMLNVLLGKNFATSSNTARPMTTPKNFSHLSLKEKIELGMSVETVDIDEWSTKALKFNVSQIHSLQEIYAYLRLLAGCPYGHVKLQNLTIKRARARIDAITEKKNYIPYLNISVGSYLQKPAIVIIGGIKGCQWLTVAALMNIAQNLTVFYDRNYEHTKRITWILIPVLNPDGYNLTLSDKKMINWQKNMGKPRKPKPKSKLQEKHCFGVNLVLNFEYQWKHYNYKNASWCDENFADQPFSQNESASVRDTVIDHIDTVKIFVMLGQNARGLMYPFRYTPLKPLFWNTYEKVVKKAALAAQSQHKRSFNYGHVLKFENETAGELDDWIMAHLGVNLGFTFQISEWMDNNKNLTEQEVSWTNDETFAALVTIAKEGLRFKKMGTLPTDGLNVCEMSRSVNIFVIIITWLQTMFFLN